MSDTTPHNTPVRPASPRRMGRALIRWAITVVVLALGASIGALAGLAARQSMPPALSSTTLVSVHAPGTKDRLAAQSLSVQWAKTLEAVGRSHEVMESARDLTTVGGNFASSQVSISQVEGSTVVAIRATAPTPEAARDISKAVFDALQKRVTDLDVKKLNGVDVMQLSAASEPVDSRPSAILLVGAGALVGLLAAFGALRLGLWLGSLRRPSPESPTPTAE